MSRVQAKSDVPTHRHTFEELFSRLGKQEQTTARLETALNNMGENVAAAVRGIESLRGSIAKGTDWGVLAAWAGVILVAVGYVGNLVISPIREQVAAQQRQQEGALVQVAALTERVRWVALQSCGLDVGNDFDAIAAELPVNALFPARRKGAILRLR